MKADESHALRGDRVAVLGAGRQGTCAAFDFLRYGGAAEVLLADESAAALAAAEERLERLVPGATVRTLSVDAGDERALARVLEGATAAVCALPYRFGPAAAGAAVRAGCHLADLGGNTEVSARILALHDEAACEGVCLVPDTGLAPGLANTLAAAGIARLDPPRSVRIWCGGLPDPPVGPFGYRLVFSVEGLINEYSGDAVYLRDGKEVRVPALSELEQLELPGIGLVEAFPTSGGTSTAPRSWAGRVERYEYRTVRYPGHRDRFLALSDAGLFASEPVELACGVRVAPRELLAELLSERLAVPDVRDVVVLRVEVTGGPPDDETAIVFDMLDRGGDDDGFTAMERTTAHPAAIVAEMAAAGEIEPGSRPLELEVPPDRFIARLQRRPLALGVRGPAPLARMRGK
jgi:lysine 6-dehydrogenase